AALRGGVPDLLSSRRRYPSAVGVVVVVVRILELAPFRVRARPVAEMRVIDGDASVRRAPPTLVVSTVAAALDLGGESLTNSLGEGLAPRTCSRPVHSMPRPSSSFLAVSRSTT